MKYRDLITLFVSVLLFLSIGFTLGVDNNYWPAPVVFLVSLAIIYYKLWK